MRAAYNYGDEWLDQLMEYLQGNLDFLIKYVSVNLPKVPVMVAEATYLVWLEFKNYAVESQELHKKLKYPGKIWLDQGYMFGTAGEGFERINIACPRSVLEEGLKRIKNCINEL